MELDPATMDAHERYRLMISCVVPRPIAWVSTQAADGTANLAPFSFFGAFSTRPPTIAVAPGQRKGGPKDTLANIQSTGEFVVAIPTEATAEAMVQTSADYAPEVSEFEAAGLTPRPASVVAPPLVGESPVNLECRCDQVIRIGDYSHVVLGEVVRFHIDDAVLAEDGVVDPRKLRAIGRLGAQWYCRTTDLFEIPRPSAPA